MHSGPGMNVGICREIVVAMTQPRLNIFQRVSKIEHDRGAAMMKIVETRGRGPDLGDYPLEAAVNGPVSR